MFTSKPTTKAQTTIPQPARVALGLEVGDEIATEIQDHRVVLTKAKGSGAAFAFTTFEEWDSAADQKAYAGL